MKIDVTLILIQDWLSHVYLYKNNLVMFYDPSGLLETVVFGLFKIDVVTVVHVTEPSPEVKEWLKEVPNN